MEIVIIFAGIQEVTLARKRFWVGLPFSVLTGILVNLSQTKWLFFLPAQILWPALAVSF